MHPLPARVLFCGHWREQLQRAVPRGDFCSGRGGCVLALPARHLLCQRDWLLLHARHVPCARRRWLLPLPLGPLLRYPGHSVRRVRRGHV